MSAHKTAIVRLGEAEYQRLRAAEEELRMLELRNGENHRTDDSSIFNQILEENRVRDQEFSALVTDLDAAAAAAIREAEEWFSQQNRAALDHIQNVEQNAADWVDQVAQEMLSRQETLERVLIQEAEHKDQQVALARNQRNMEDSEDAYAQISTAQKILEYLASEYPLDLNSANELEILRGEIDDSVRYYQSKRYDWAWQTARTVNSQLSRLRFRLEDDRRTRETLHQQLIQQSREVHQRIVDQQGVQAMDVDGNELPERIDTSFWTDGAYAHLLDQTRQACLVLESLESPDLNELAEWREEIAILHDRGLELVTQARLAVLASQLRFNVAQIVVQALETQGFYLEAASYQQNDYRGSFCAQTRNLAGNEVVITIDPDPGLEEGGRLRIDSVDSSLVTEHELRLRTKEIYAAIQSYGVSVNSTDSQPKGTNPKSIPSKVSESRQRYQTGRTDPQDPKP